MSDPDGMAPVCGQEAMENFTQVQREQKERDEKGRKDEIKGGERDASKRQLMNERGQLLNADGSVYKDFDSGMVLFSDNRASDDPTRMIDAALSFFYPLKALVAFSKINPFGKVKVAKDISEITAKGYSEATFNAFKKQLESNGMKSILKTQTKIERNLQEHSVKLTEITKSGGFSSSVEREIRTFESQLKAIKDLLK